MWQLHADFCYSRVRAVPIPLGIHSNAVSRRSLTRHSSFRVQELEKLLWDDAMTDFASLLRQRGHRGQTLGWCMKGARQLDQASWESKENEEEELNRGNITSANSSVRFCCYCLKHIPSSEGAAAFQGISCKPENKKKNINNDPKTFMVVRFTCVPSSNLLPFGPSRQKMFTP